MHESTRRLVGVLNNAKVLVLCIHLSTDVNIAAGQCIVCGGRSSSGLPTVISFIFTSSWAQQSPATSQHSLLGTLALTTATHTSYSYIFICMFWFAMQCNVMYFQPACVSITWVRKLLDSLICPGSAGPSNIRIIGMLLQTKSGAKD